MAGYGAREASVASRASACCLLLHDGGYDGGYAAHGGCMWLYVAVCGCMWLYVAVCGCDGGYAACWLMVADNGWIWGARGERSEPSMGLLPAG